MNNFQFDSRLLQRVMSKIDLEKAKKNNITITIEGTDDKLGTDITQKDIDEFMSLGISIEFRNVQFNRKIFRDASLKYLSFYKCDLQQCAFDNCTIEELKGEETNFGNDLSILENIKGLRKLALFAKFVNRKSFNKEYPGIVDLSIFEQMPYEEFADVIKSIENNTLYYAIDDINFSYFPDLEELELNDFRIDDSHLFRGENNLLRLKKLILRSCYEEGKSQIPLFSPIEFLEIDDIPNVVVFFPVMMYLKQLKLSGNYLESIEWIKLVRDKCPRLQALDLSDSIIPSEMIEAPTYRRQLQSLHNSTTEFKSPKYIISSFYELTPTRIKELNEAGINNFGILDDFYEHYNSNQIKEILSILRTIKDSVPEMNDPELTKEQKDLINFTTALTFIGIIADYDDSGNEENEYFTPERKKITRSLLGALCEGKAVCYGYALAMQDVCEYLGLECNMIVGATSQIRANGNLLPNMIDSGHAWNQIKIGDKWYNFDLTWDYKLLRAIMQGDDNVELYYILKSDEEFKLHYATEEALKDFFERIHLIDLSDEEFTIHQCDESFPTNQLKCALRALRDGKDIITSEDLTPEQNEQDSGNVTRASYQGIAIETPISPEFKRELVAATLSQPEQQTQPKQRE